MSEGAGQQVTEPQAAPLVGRVNGEPMRLPDDLYIPPEALEVFLRSFEGPLDLLLYLIRRKNLDILEIPIRLITRQYIEYIELMQELKLELASEYLLMAAMLAEIKSRLLLPRPVVEDEEDAADPRAELVRRLQEYERFRQAAADLDELPRAGRDYHTVHTWVDGLEDSVALPEPELDALLAAYRAAMLRAELKTDHHVEREKLSVADRMRSVLDRLRGERRRFRFDELLSVDEGRAGVVVTFLAILELLKGHFLTLMQTEALGALYIEAAEDEA